MIRAVQASGASPAASGGSAWDVVAGGRFVVAFPAPAPGAVLEAFERAATGSPSLEALIGAIPLGADGVTGFALVWWPRTGSTMTAVVRGDAAVDLASPGGRRRLEGRGILPWHLAEFRDVEALRIGAGSSARGASDGVAADAGFGAPDGRRFRAESIEWRTATAAGSAAPDVAETSTTTWDTAWDPAAHAGDPAPGDEDAGEDADEVADARSVERAFGFRVGSAAARTSVGRVLIGRRPRPPRITVEPVELVEVDGPDTVSGTHLELRREGDRVVATDLRSTNGTVIRTSAGARRMLAGESVVVPPGALLELGGATIVEILPTQEDPNHPDRQAPA
ncbi:FHA domain-containing protein [Agromyces sp. LHK192]|uniref:FHA domain-containing protein n=1 Tax=Agromyces sp. LHK192 TaxID=2498704 RepID=UPI0013E3A431|nr:FHA domain-containing protein [Agromyces sp. LHK192]